MIDFMFNRAEEERFGSETVNPKARWRILSPDLNSKLGDLFKRDRNNKESPKGRVLSLIPAFYSSDAGYLHSELAPASFPGAAFLFDYGERGRTPVN